MIGFVLIKIKLEKEEEVYQRLSNTPGIVDLHPLFGIYDLIVKIEATDMDKLGEIVVEKIRKTPGVLDTETLPRFEFK